jgi:hypothetical protein
VPANLWAEQPIKPKAIVRFGSSFWRISFFIVLGNVHSVLDLGEDEIGAA